MTKVQYITKIDSEGNKIIRAYADDCSNDLIKDIEKDIKRGKYNEAFISYFNKNKEDFLLMDRYEAIVTWDGKDEWDEEKGKKCAMYKLISKLELRKFRIMAQVHNKLVDNIGSIRDRSASYISKVADFTNYVGDNLGYIKYDDVEAVSSGKYIPENDENVETC